MEWQRPASPQFRSLWKAILAAARVATPALLGAMLRAADKISDLVFSPGRPPQVQVHGQLIAVQVAGLRLYTR